MKPTSAVIVLATLLYAGSTAAICCVSAGPGSCADVPNLGARSAKGFINARTGELLDRGADACCCAAASAAACLSQCG